MASTGFIHSMQGKVVLMVGTVKGAFLYTGDPARKVWEPSGPHFPGHVVYAMAYDGRAGRNRIWCSSTHFAFGTILHSSDDFGVTWTNPESSPIKFPEDTGAALKQIWQIAPGRADEPNKLYCGVEPAALFESNDAGETWSLVRGLWEHPHRAQWQPGGGGLCLHTIVPDPANRSRIHVGVSTGGHYCSDDGGKTWLARNKGLKAEFMPEGQQFPEFGQCVHKIARSGARPGRLYLQNHGGLYRSDDAGDSWQEIATGVPSDFGFPMAVHPRDPDRAFIFPLDREMRCGPEGKVRVYRTRNAGATWEAQGEGLPQDRAYETVLRDAMNTDTLEPAGVYFGTRSGKLYGSSDEGTNWQLIADGLPAITCVKTAVV